MKKTTQALWAFLLFCAVVLLEQFTGLDAAVQNHFFDFASGLWLVDEERNPVMHFLLYDGIKILLVVLAVGAAGVLAASFKKPVLKKLRYGCILFLLAMAFIPLVIAGAKKATNVYCPYQVTLYGGENPYAKVLSRYPPDYDFTVHKRGHCFPAGHASGGFALMILFFCFKKKKYKIAGLCLGLAAGWGMGLYQMWRGEHFLSHTLCTLFAAWLMCLLLAAFMERVQKKYPAFFALCGPK